MREEKSPKWCIMEQIKEREENVQSTEYAPYNKGLKREICSYGRRLLLGLKLFC